MAKKVRYHITQNPNGDWQGKKEKSGRASVVSPTKEKALAETIKLAKKQPEAEVIIHKANGKIQSERTYGSDPYPPEG